MQQTSTKPEERGKKSKEKGEISLQWFRFYVYIHLPMTFLYSLAVGLGAPFLWLISLFALILFVGLWKRKLWTWRLNFLWLAGSLLIIPIYIITAYNFPFLSWGIILMYSIPGLIWVVPNWIYFKKRKQIFTENKRDQ